MCVHVALHSFQKRHIGKTSISIIFMGCFDGTSMSRLQIYRQLANCLTLQISYILNLEYICVLLSALSLIFQFLENIEMHVDL